MGEFTQNLLKLTEFPFSYSLMGLLALIFGHGTNLEKLSFEKIGPLLILIGFVATTLSICDPVGALQRVIIQSHRLIIERRRPLEVDPKQDPDPGYKRIYCFLNTMIFGRVIVSHFFLPYIFAIRYSPEDMKKFPEKDIFLRASENIMRAHLSIGNQLSSCMRRSGRECML